MTDQDRAIGRLEGEFKTFKEYEEQEHLYLRQENQHFRHELKEIKDMLGKNDIKWARLGGIAAALGAITGYLAKFI